MLYLKQDVQKEKFDFFLSPVMKLIHLSIFLLHTFLMETFALESCPEVTKGLLSAKSNTWQGSLVAFKIIDSYEISLTQSYRFETFIQCSSAQVKLIEKTAKVSMEVKCDSNQKCRRKCPSLCMDLYPNATDNPPYKILNYLHQSFIVVQSTTTFNDQEVIGLSIYVDNFDTWLEYLSKFSKVNFKV